MRRRWLITLSLFLCLVSCLVPSLPVRAADKGEQFSALAVVPGMRMVGAGSTASVNIYVEEYTSDADTQRYAQS